MKDSEVSACSLRCEKCDCIIPAIEPFYIYCMRKLCYRCEEELKQARLQIQSSDTSVAFAE